MRTVRASQACAGSVHEAERCWYDTSSWPAWVDGLDRVIEVRGAWPGPGSRVVWESGPAGRGRVSELVVAHESLVGQTLAVADDSIRGHQTVSFTPVDEGVEVSLSLQYELTRRSIIMPAIDILFIRRAMERSLAATLARFAVELADRRG